VRISPLYSLQVHIYYAPHKHAKRYCSENNNLHFITASIKKASINGNKTILHKIINPIEHPIIINRKYHYSLFF